jgi:hypothetical protein
MKRAIHYLTILLLLTALASCRNKQKIVSSTETTTTITEKVDTTVTVRGDSIKFVTPIQSLIVPKIIETEVQKVVVAYNAQTGEVSVDAIAKDREVPVNIDRTTKTTTKEDKREKTITQPERPKQTFWGRVLTGIKRIFWFVLVFCGGVLVGQFFKPFRLSRIFTP